MLPMGTKREEPEQDDTAMTAERRRFSCTEPGCGKEFYRSEHLSRHRLNHRPKQVYQCSRCPKKFVRKDLVQRHEKRHEKGMWFRNSGGVVNAVPDSHAESMSPQDPVPNPHFTPESQADDGMDETAVTMQPQPQVPRVPFGMAGGMPAGMAAGMPIDYSANSLFFDSSPDMMGQTNDFNWFFEGVPAQLSPLETVDFNGPPSSHPSSVFIPPAPFAAPVAPVHFSPPPTTSVSTPWSAVRTKLLEALYTFPPDILESSFFYPTNLASFFELYFANYHPHFPIFHRPTLLLADIPPLLMTAIVSLGATLTPDESHYRVATRLHDTLRWVVFCSGAFEPPAPLWCLQTLLLLQAHEKMFSTRKHHEMAHIFHSSIITLMRRGTAYTGMPIAPEQPGTELEQSWHRWAANEASKRTAFFAFIMDAQHTFMFGHTCVLSAHDVQLSLPCSETLWTQTTPEDWARVLRETPEPPRFLQTLKGLLCKTPVPSNCSAYSRFILLHGLLSVTANCHARDLATLGVGRPSSERSEDSYAPSSMDVWRDILERAIDTWSFSLLSRESSLSLEAAKPLHRMAHVAICTNIIDFHIVAGAPPLLGSPLSRHDYTNARNRVLSWSKKPASKKALYHCLLLIQETVFTGRRYLAAQDNIALRPWCLYHATLVLWAYGHMTAEPNASLQPDSDSTDSPLIKSGESSAMAVDTSNNSGTMGAEEYLVRMLMLLKGNQTSEALDCADQTRGLIISVRESLENCRWELLQEAYVTLGRLIGISPAGGV